MYPNKKQYNTNQTKKPSKEFMKGYADNFDYQKSLSLDSFDLYGKEFEKLQSNSQIRKIYDSYLDILNGPGDKDVKIQIWFAKIAYQEKRKVLTDGFTKFLNIIYDKISDKEKFKDFLEVFVAYHKYFNTRAK